MYVQFVQGIGIRYVQEINCIILGDYKCINWYYERLFKLISRVYDYFILCENDVMMKDV